MGQQNLPTSGVAGEALTYETMTGKLTFVDKPIQELAEFYRTPTRSSAQRIQPYLVVRALNQDVESPTHGIENDVASLAPYGLYPY